MSVEIKFYQSKLKFTKIPRPIHAVEFIFLSKFSKFTKNAPQHKSSILSEIENYNFSDNQLHHWYF